mgnify:CR=1 FL=1
MLSTHQHTLTHTDTHLHALYLTSPTHIATNSAPHAVDTRLQHSLRYAPSIALHNSPQLVSNTYESHHRQSRSHDRQHNSRNLSHPVFPISQAYQLHPPPPHTHSHIRPHDPYPITHTRLVSPRHLVCPEDSVSPKDLVSPRAGRGGGTAALLTVAATRSVLSRRSDLGLENKAIITVAIEGLDGAEGVAFLLEGDECEAAGDVGKLVLDEEGAAGALETVLAADGVDEAADGVVVGVLGDVGELDGELNGLVARGESVAGLVCVCVDFLALGALEEEVTVLTALTALHSSDLRLSDTINFGFLEGSLLLLGLATNLNFIISNCGNSFLRAGGKTYFRIEERR